MKVLGIIPARYASSRFPGKPLIDLKGKSMIERVYEGAQKATHIDHLVVATDDQRIYDEVLRFGGNVRMTSPTHQSGTERCAEVLSHFPNYDTVINIQGDEPLVSGLQLDQLIDVFSDSEVRIATLVHANVTAADLHNVNRIKVLADHKQNALYFSRSPIPNMHYAQAKIFAWLRHIGMYAYTAEVLRNITTLAPCALEQAESLEQLRWLYYGYQIRLVQTNIETPNIDVPADLEKVLPFL